MKKVVEYKVEKEEEKARKNNTQMEEPIIEPVSKELLKSERLDYRI